MPDTDNVVRVARKEGLTVRGPGHGDALGDLCFFGDFWELWDELVDDGLGGEVPDLDARGGGGTEPVAEGGEAEGGDGVADLEGVQVLALVEVPEHDDAVLSARGTEGAVGGDGDAVHVARVSVVVGLELELGQVPDLDELVPPGRDDDGVLGVGREADA